MTPWFLPLRSVRSLGSQHKGAGSLAGLHAARAEHLSQFFTPEPLVDFVWRLVEPSIERARTSSGVEGERVSLFDNSVGSGRLLWMADPAKHTLSGVDVHEDSIKALGAAAGAAQFRCDFAVGRMEEIRPRGYGVGLINPPFSILLESPNLMEFPCNTYGRFGPGSSCMSHVYAVAQALSACDIVAAILPLTFAETLPSDPHFNQRLVYLARLPNNAFRSEGAEVSTAVAVWDAYPRDGGIVEMGRIDDLSAPTPRLDLTCRPESKSQLRPIRVRAIEDSGPSITTPVTGNRRVRVVHHNRFVSLRFSCGLVEAKVRNAVLRDELSHYDRPPGCRYPSSVRYSGQGLLDLEAHLMAENPQKSFRELLGVIRKAGGLPAVDEGIFGYLRRREKKLRRHRVELRHTIFVPAGSVTGEGTGTVTPRRTFLLDNTKMASPLAKVKESYPARNVGAGRYEVTIAGRAWPFSADDLEQRFDCGGLTNVSNCGSWVTKFPGRALAFPQVAKHYRQTAKRLGLDKFLSWDYQLDDMVEVAMSPFGAVVAWDMGLGKARLAIALCLVHEAPHNLIVVEPHLVDEMLTELKKVGIAEDAWQVIASAEGIKDLRRINVITYNRLRMALHSACPKRTYAKALRHRISTLVADEGHVVRNLDTDQTRALWQVAARRRFVCSGTPIANYPRDLLPVACFVAGDGTAAQPFGLCRAYLEKRLARSMRECRRGLDVFREKFVVLEWSTNEFADTLREGAKREVPKIASLPEFRQFAAPLIKRRVSQEPDVARHFRIPVPTERHHSIKWDDGHLAHYLEVAEEFAAWYRDVKATGDGRNLNLSALLARIGAVEAACNTPHKTIGNFGSYQPLTSKQRFAIERIVALVGEGHKVVFYAKSPAVLERLATELTERGIDSVVLHGGKSIESRTAELNARFRFGPVPVLLASLGCTQTGLNLYQGTRAIFYGRDWSAKTERQARARLLRPQQKERVEVEYLQLEGSIDDYAGQLVDMKADAADSGLDWATPEKADAEFVHLDTMLGRFVENLAKLRGVARQAVRDVLVA